MNKLFTFLASAALVGSFTACSSDEPAKGPDQGTNPEDGTTMYLNVNITDANAVGRANGDTEGDYVPSTTEHDVETAHFFFFDADGIYVTQAEVWNGGKDVDDEKHNVEYLGKNVLVLEGLKEKSLPKYLVTVLNAPENLADDMLKDVTTIDDLRTMTANYKNKKGNFIMTTSSFLDGAKEYPGFYEDARYYANVIPGGYLTKEPVTDLANAKALQIYVERLAAKYTIELPNSNKFQIQLTVAGEKNENDDNVEIGDTQMWVEITGFGVTCIEPKSYLSKNLDKFSLSESLTNWKNATNPTPWNAANYHRSFWGKSVNYDNASASVLSATTFYASQSNGTTGIAYSNENTTTAANISSDVTIDGAPKLLANRVTNIVFTAKVTDKDGKDIEDLISFGGVFYKNDQFKKYLLARVAEVKGLNYYVFDGEVEEQETITNPDGSTTTTTHKVKKYHQVGLDDITYVKVADKRNGFMTVKFAGGDATVLYSFDDSKPEGQKYTAIQDGVKELNSKLTYLFGTSNYPERYKGGATVYTIPVEHLLGLNKGTVDNNGVRTPFTVTEGEGEYGVVRNHWYKITLNKISKIGNGVFNPDKGTDEEDTTDTITPDPDPDPDTYAMAASIKILSWKIVKQTVDL